MPDEFVSTLIRDLRRRLEELEEERSGISRALRALEERPPKRRRDLGALLIRRIEDSPGSRASFLALEFGVSSATMNAQLQKLEQNGLIVKRGLGWEWVGPLDSPA